MKSTEKETQKACLELLSAKRIFHYRQNTGAFSNEYTRKSDGVHKKSFIRYGTPGASDIVAVINGGYVAIEIKGEDGEQNPDQVAFQKALEKAGGVYLLVKNVDTLIYFLQKNGKR